MNFEFLRRRPIVVGIAGSNGAGKSTFFEAHLSDAGMVFVNANEIAKGLRLGAYDAAAVAEQVRASLLDAGESFVFETVFSDPEGDKVEFLETAQARGHTVVLFFIGIDRVATSHSRVAMRAAQGGHDVPPEKLDARYPRTLRNLTRAIACVEYVIVLDNSDMRHPYRRIAVFERGSVLELADPPPTWLADALGDIC